VSGTTVPTTPPTIAPTFVFEPLLTVDAGEPVFVFFGPELVATVLIGFGFCSGSRPRLIATLSVYVWLGEEVTL
jgi:hypothetical protein